MRQRYEVFKNRKWFASVHAATEEEAITRACKFTGSKPERCVAVLGA